LFYGIVFQSIHGGDNTADFAIVKGKRPPSLKTREIFPIAGDMVFKGVSHRDLLPPPPYADKGHKQSKFSGLKLNRIILSCFVLCFDFIVISGLSICKTVLG
jgi:hypothetical protein